MEIWREHLKTNHIGIEGNFFELGGHLLLATQMIARLRHVLEIDPPLRTIFEYPTIAQLAQTIGNQLSQTFPDWSHSESSTQE